MSSFVSQKKCLQFSGKSCHHLQNNLKKSLKLISCNDRDKLPNVYQSCVLNVTQEADIRLWNSAFTESKALEIR